MAARLAFFPLLMVTVAAQAAAVAGEGSQALSNGPGWSELLRVTFTLGLVVAMIFGLSVAVRRWQGDRRFSPEIFKVLAAISLGNKDKIYLVQVGNEQIVVGSSIGRLTTLHTMKENIVLEPEVSQQLAANHRFADVLRSLGKGFHQ